MGVAGYYIDIATRPLSATDPIWSSQPPTSYAVSPTLPNGNLTLYAWVKDAAGNVSASKSSTTYVDLTNSDKTRPTVTSFAAPGQATSRTIPILSFTATDNFGVTGYAVTAHDSTSDALWTSMPPTSYTVPARFSGTVTLYAWARDAAGNSGSRTVAIEGVPPAVAPDLAVTQVTNSAATITSSRRTFEITDTVTNRGSATAGPSKTQYKLYGIKTSSWSTTKWTSPLTGVRPVPALKPGESSTGTATVTVPAGTETLTWYVWACADGENVVDELVEYECTQSATQITVR